MVVNSPERFDLAKRCLYIGSMDWLTPLILEIVAVGAIAIVLELRMPCSFTAARTVSQSRVELRSTSRWPPRSASTSAAVSMGRMPRLHLEPW